MPPKKNTGDKKKQESDQLELTDKLKQAAARIEALERELVLRGEENIRLAAELRTFETTIKRLTSDMDSERADRHDVAVDMTRQFKTMQDELLKDIADRERGIENIRAQAAKERIQLESEIRERDEIISKKDTEIVDLKNRLDQLSREFSAILRETLDTISEKIEYKTNELNV
ncbi:hypothetical protein GMRT_14279 [Giardia muris]|uniref:Dynein regulatory complex protein 12 n=1 Tax=Giardia muris TaxID=5742 RepID=A0A4Z1SXB7_GIAMU|nr:hypothetical protein GMRT_14279 [Giardia muris]|eukprot:TNJ30180.1 hypothetical protein GMRT_14279 [Giardia muris]